MSTVNQVHVNAILTSFSQQFANEDFIADSVLPWLDVKKRSDLWFQYDKDERFTQVQDTSGPRATGNEVNFNLSTDSYSVRDYELREFVANEEKDNQDEPLDLEMDAAEFIMNLLGLNREKRVRDIAFDPSVYPAANKVTLTGTDQWTDTANSDPLKDITDGLDATFLRPNKMIFGKSAWTVFRRHPKILDAVKGGNRLQNSGGGLANKSEIAELFEVDQVIIGRAKVNSAKKGQTAVFSDIWDDRVALLRVLDRPRPRSVTFGCSLTSKRMLTRTWEDPARGVSGGTMIQTSYNVDEKVKAAEMGFLISDTNA